MNAWMTQDLRDSELQAMEVEARQLIDICLDCFERENIRCHSSLWKLASWINNGRRGERTTIVSTACPAYSYDKPSGAPPRYTYGALAGDIGLAGNRFFRSIDSVHRLFRQDLRIADLRHEVLVADFEGFAETTLRRVGATATDFGRKCRQTARAYQEQGAERIHADRFSDVFGGRTRWVRELTQMMNRADAGEFGALLDKKRLIGIGEERRATFEEFFREPIGDDTMMEQLVSRRAIELATAGKLMCGPYRNPLILSVSDERFAAFFGLAADAPILDMSGME